MVDLHYSLNVSGYCHIPFDNSKDNCACFKNSYRMNETDSRGNEKQGSETSGQLRALSEINTYVIVGCSVWFAVFAILGYIDAKYIRKNELFRWTGIVFCGTYTLDFVSGMSFLACVSNSIRVVCC